MNEELDNFKIDENQSEETIVQSAQSPAQETTSESKAELENTILDEHNEEDNFDTKKLASKSLEEMLEEAEKVLVLTPSAASKNLKAIRPVFFEKFNNEKQAAQLAFEPAGEEQEEETEEFIFEKEELFEKFNFLLNQIKLAQKEEKERIEKDKQDNLKLKLELLARLEDLVKEDETTESIDKVKEIQHQWKTIRFLPKEEISKLWDRYNILLDKFYDNHGINIELKELDRKKNLETKIELTKKVEELHKENSLKRSFILLNKYHEEFKNAGPVPKESREAIWHAFKPASDSVYEQKRKVYEELEVGKEDNLKKKQILVEKAELLNAVTPENAKAWNKKYEDFENLFADWKKIGPIPRSNKDAVWISFNSIRNDFYTKRKEFYKALNSVRNENLKLKEVLCDKVEALKDNEDWGETSKAIIRLQKEWKEIGPVPDKVNQAIWKRFRAACDHFFNNKNTAFAGQRVKEEENLKQKEVLIQKLETLLESKGNAKTVFAELKQISSDWRTIGYVPLKAVKRINTGYDKANNAVYKKFSEQIKEAKHSNLKQHYIDIKQGPNGTKSLDFEARGIKKKISFLNDEIAGIERNMSFFAKSKTAEKLLKDFDQRIAKINGQIKNLKQELSAIKTAHKATTEVTAAEETEVEEKS